MRLFQPTMTDSDPKNDGKDGGNELKKREELNAQLTKIVTNTDFEESKSKHNSMYAEIQRVQRDLFENLEDSPEESLMDLNVGDNFDALLS